MRNRWRTPEVLLVSSRPGQRKQGSVVAAALLVALALFAWWLMTRAAEEQTADGGRGSDSEAPPRPGCEVELGEGAPGNTLVRVESGPLVIAVPVRPVRGDLMFRVTDLRACDPGWTMTNSGRWVTDGRRGTTDIETPRGDAEVVTLTAI